MSASAVGFTDEVGPIILGMSDETPSAGWACMHHHRRSQNIDSAGVTYYIYQQLHAIEIGEASPLV